MGNERISKLRKVLQDQGLDAAFDFRAQGVDALLFALGVPGKITGSNDGLAEIHEHFAAVLVLG